MPVNLRGRSVLTLDDFTPQEIRYLLRLSVDLKSAKLAGTEQPRLKGKNIALIFEKDSTRTRTGFEVAACDQGAHVTYLGPTGSQIGHKESMKDTARVLGRVYDAIEYRGFGQSVAEDLARHAGVPVYNGLTDESHPTQTLADFATMREFTHKHLSDLAVTFLGDGRNNVARSLAVGAAKVGIDMRIAAPKSLWPDRAFLDHLSETAAGNGGKFRLFEDAQEAVAGADFLYTDVWVSMGEADSIWAERIKLLTPYRITAALMEATGNPFAKFMHCLPAFHNTETEVGAEIAKKFGIDCMEVTEEVFESPGSIVFDQAENRMHTIKAILVATLGELTMLVVAALGGNALLKRGEALSAENQRANVRKAAAALAALIRAGHRVVVTHGNGPQVGLLALQSASGPVESQYPLDVLGAESEGMIGYLIEQELRNALPERKLFATLLTQSLVDPRDPAFKQPTKPIGPVYDEATARRLGRERGWTVAADGGFWRRVVPSPKPIAILEVAEIALLVEQGVIVTCAGGGGIPVARDPDGALKGVEAVVDKDLASALLAVALKADKLLLLTDVDAVYENHGSDRARAILRTSPALLAKQSFPSGSMAPKVEAAANFATGTEGTAAIGRLEDALRIVSGDAGTQIDPRTTNVVYRP